MKILVIGDIFGKKGRSMIQKYIPDLAKKHDPDFLIANSENICHGKGPKMQHIEFLIEQGFDLLTGGNHTLSHLGDIKAYLQSEKCLQLRPDNYADPGLPGKGWKIIEKNNKKILVVNVLSGVFMRDQVENPFLRAQKHILEHKDSVDACLVDFHKETTSEGYGMANLLDGQASLVWGTHTHVQTNDEQILPGGTGFINDIGFCGAYQSVIGVKWESISNRFLTGMQTGRMLPDDKSPGVLSGIVAEIIDGKCVKIEKIRIREDD